MKSLNTDAVYKKLIENMNEAVWVWDEQERTVYANPKFCSLLGYTLEEIIWEESYIFWDEESKKRVQEENTKKRKKWESSSYEWNLLTKSWEKIPVLLSGTPLPDGGTIGIMTDLSQLKEKESIYKKLVENMNEAVWMGDKNEKTIYANPKFCDLVWYELWEIIGEESYMFWDEESKGKVRHENTYKRTKWESSSYEWNLLTKAGKIIPVIANGTSLSDGGTIGIMTDVRQIKEKEENERILVNAVKFSTDAIIMFSKNGAIYSWNNGSQMMFWYKQDQILWKSIHTLFSEEDCEQMFSSDVKTNKYELNGRHKNGTQLSLALTVTVITQKKKSEERSYLLICRDITNQRKIEEEMEIKYRKIREVYERIGVIKRQSDYIFDLLDMYENYSHDMKSVGDFIVTSIIMLTQVDACLLRLYDKEKDSLKMISNFWLWDNWEWKKIIKYKNSIAEKAFKNKKPYKILELSREPLYQSNSLARQNNLSSMLLIPLKSKGKFLWTLSLYTRPDKKLEIFENEFIEEYARVIEVVIEAML